MDSSDLVADASTGVVLEEVLKLHLDGIINMLPRLCANDGANLPLPYRPCAAYVVYIKKRIKLQL